MNQETLDKIQANSSGNMGEFIQNYRTSLEDQYNADTQAIENQRNLGYTSIMSGANRRGLLHSSFPTISKLQYDVNTYEPALVKARQSYQTGLDSLYSNVAKNFNTIKSLQEKIADLNAL